MQHVLFSIQIRYWLVTLQLVIVTAGLAQPYTITGKVTDATTGDPVPFANVYLLGTQTGATTDFDGLYKIVTSQLADSLVASYIGYKWRAKKVQELSNQQINFQLQPDVMNLEEIVIVAGENPAFEILRKLRKNSKMNDKRSLSAYSFESYNKTEVDIDNISDRVKKRKFMKKIYHVLDSMEKVVGEDGNPIIPVFISESLSSYYYRKNPSLVKEYIHKSNITGVGLEDGSFVSQLIGTSFREINFYQEWIGVLRKKFISPISDIGRVYYNYDLMDSMVVDGHFCYRIDFTQKSEQDLAFQGSMWITKKEYALKQIDASLGKSANLNFIDKIKIQQSLLPTSAGPWLADKTRILIDIGELSKYAAGMLAKFYTSNKNFEVNDPKDPRFYQVPVEVDKLAYKKDDEFWQANRHEKLSDTELHVYAMIDTLSNIPVVKSYVELAKIAINGHKRIGKIDLGPYLLTYAVNEVEGSRFQLGLRTNEYFSKHFEFKGFAAYGTKDERFKYNAALKCILSRKRWSTLSISRGYDMGQVGIIEDELQGRGGMFYASTRFGRIMDPYYSVKNKASLSSEVLKGVTQSVYIKNESFEPQFNFQFYNNLGEGDSTLTHSYINTEIGLQLQIATDVNYVINGNDRILLSTNKWPIIRLGYAMGVGNVLESDFDYYKINFALEKYFTVGLLGRSDVRLSGGYVFSTLPYPLLYVHLGNETFFYSTAAYNLMNLREFTSDAYAALRIEHHFEGFLLNRLPIIRKLKLRLVGVANILYGQLRTENKEIIPNLELNSLGELPYIELGYGIENIFKIIRVDAYHRLTYLDGPNVTKFGVKANVQFRF